LDRHIVLRHMTQIPFKADRYQIGKTSSPENCLGILGIERNLAGHVTSVNHVWLDGQLVGRGATREDRRAR